MTPDGNSQRGKDVLIVTGSSGLIGSAVIDAFRRRFQVVGFDRDGQPQPPPEVECVCVDLTDDASVALGFDRVRYAYGGHIGSVVHLAAYYDFSGEPGPLYEEVTVRGTERLLRGLQDFTVEQFIFSSTMLVHAPTEPGAPINEEWPLEPRWDYPESKVRTEELIRAERGDIPALMLRIAGVYTDRCDSLPLSRQIRRILEHRLTGHVFPGDASHGQSMVHLDDVVDAIRRGIERRRSLPAEAAVLIGEARTYSYDTLQGALAALIHNSHDWQTTEIPKDVARTGAWIRDKVPGLEEPFIKPWMIDLADDHYELDISRARGLLGWEPRHDLIATLPKMIAALREDPRAWYERHGLEAPRPLPELAPARA